GELARIEARPHATRAPEIGNPRLGAHAGAGERHRPPRTGEQRGQTRHGRVVAAHALSGGAGGGGAGVRATHSAQSAKTARPAATAILWAGRPTTVTPSAVCSV